MTAQDVRTKVASIVEGQDFKETLNKELTKILEGGGIDLKTYENDYRAPKIILSAVLHNLAWQYEPLSADDRQVAKNLSQV